MLSQLTHSLCSCWIEWLTVIIVMFTPHPVLTQHVCFLWWIEPFKIDDSCRCIFPLLCFCKQPKMALYLTSSSLSLSVHPFLCGRRREELRHWLEKDDDHAVNLGVPNDQGPQHSTLVTSSKHALRIGSHIEGRERILCIEYFLFVSHHHPPHFFFLCGTWYSVILPPLFYSLVGDTPSLSNLSPDSYWTFFLRGVVNELASPC